MTDNVTIKKTHAAERADSAVADAHADLQDMIGKDMGEEVVLVSIIASANPDSDGAINIQLLSGAAPQGAMRIMQCGMAALAQDIHAIQQELKQSETEVKH